MRRQIWKRLRSRQELQLLLKPEALELPFEEDDFELPDELEERLPDNDSGCPDLLWEPARDRGMVLILSPLMRFPVQSQPEITRYCSVLNQ